MEKLYSSGLQNEKNNKQKKTADKKNKCIAIWVFTDDNNKKFVYKLLYLQQHYEWYI